MKASNSVIVLSFVWLLVSFWNRNDLPGNIEPVPELANEPSQTATQVEPFGVEVNGVDYLIEPEYEYDLHGMIVSYRHHNGNSRMHFLANDHLNMLDVCVVWGKNASHPLLHKIKFWNGIFTCSFETSNQDAWDLFDIYEVSNNHLISDDDYIRNRVKRIRVGDQIRLSGYLASYSSEGGSKRGTSTTRLDTGDGACETLFVERFDIVRRAKNYWRVSMYVSLVLLIMGLIAHFRQPYRPYRDS